MKINRLTEIIILLLNKKIVTAKELADKFQVSTRTIYRRTIIIRYSSIYEQGKKWGDILIRGILIK